MNPLPHARHTLVEPSVVERWNRAFAGGSDKRYPSLEVVRLERWYYGGRPGRLLEYGHGSGVNLIHLLECGHTVDAIDVSLEARKVVERKMAARPEIAGRLTLSTLAIDADRLPYEDGRFDYANCISVLSLLGNRDRAMRLVDELRRVLKPGGRCIVDVNSQNSDFARGSERLPGDVFLYRGPHGAEAPVPTWCPEQAADLVALFRGFQVDDVGYAAHKYGGSEINEHIVCAHKPNAT